MDNEKGRFEKAAYERADHFHELIGQHNFAVAQAMFDQDGDVFRLWLAIDNLYGTVQGVLRAYNVPDDYKQLKKRCQKVGEEILKSRKGDTLPEIFGGASKDIQKMYFQQRNLIKDLYSDIIEVLTKLGLTVSSVRRIDPGGLMVQ